MKRPELAEIMRSRRAASGLSQRKVAELLGCQLDTVTGLESGRKAPGSETVWRLAALYCFPLAEINHCLELARHHRRNWQEYQHKYAERWARDYLKKKGRIP